MDLTGFNQDEIENLMTQFYIEPNDNDLIENINGKDYCFIIKCKNKSQLEDLMNRFDVEKREISYKKFLEMY